MTQPSKDMNIDELKKQSLPALPNGMAGSRVNPTTVKTVYQTKDMNDRIEKFLLWVMANRDTDSRRWMDEIEPELLKQLKSIISQTLNDCLPEKLNRKLDEDYGYCITCNQIVDTPQADCFCSIHNLAIDQTKANLKTRLGE